MEFSVILEGSTTPATPSEDARAELERYLRSAKIPPAAIEQLKTGKPLVVKKQLSYEQAVSISDRLMDLGLESSIYPAAKPDAPTSQKNTNIHTLKPAPAGKSTAKTKKNPPAPGKGSQPGSTTRGRQITTAATDIKGLFQLPAAGLAQPVVTLGTRLRCWSKALLGLAIPCAYGLAIIALTSLALLLLAGLYTLLSYVSVVLAILTTGILGAVAAIPLILLTVPFWPMAIAEADTMTLKAHMEPRLFMLMAAITKIIAAPTPKTIQLVAEPQLTIRLNASPGKRWAFKRNLPEQLSFCIGTPLLTSLTIRQLSGQVARACGPYIPASCRRPAAFGQVAMTWLTQAEQRLLKINDQLQPLATRWPQLRWQLLVNRVIRGQALLANLLRHGKLAYQKLWHTDPLADHYETLVAGDKALAESTEQLTKLSSAFAQTIAAMTEQAHGEGRLVNGLAALTQHYFQQGEAPPEKLPGAGVFRHDLPAQRLVAGLANYDQETSLRWYQHQGFLHADEPLVTLSSYLKWTSTKTALLEASRDYFGKWLHPQQPWLIPKRESLYGKDKNQRIQKLNQLIERLRYSSPDRPVALEKFQRVHAQLAEVETARKLDTAGIKNRLAGTQDPQALETKRNHYRGELKDLMTELGQQNALMGQRLALALSLDNSQQEMHNRVYEALRTLGECGSQLVQLALESEQLALLDDHKPKQVTQHYRLYVKELTEHISERCKLIMRKLKHCPYDFYDRRYPTLQHRLLELWQDTDGDTATQRLLTKAAITQEVLGSGLQAISSLAAYLARRAEQRYQVDSFRKL